MLTTFSLSPLHGSTIAVVGGAGYLGKFLVEKLLQEYGIQQLRLVDIGHPVMTAQYEHWVLSGKLQIHVGDMRNTEHLIEILAGVSLVFHLADVSCCSEGLRRKTVLDGTIGLLNACNSSQVQHIIFTSSYSALQPYSAKYLAEYFIRLAHGQTISGTTERRFKTCILRLATLYGEGCPSSMTRFINLVQSGFLCFTFWTQTKRDFCCVHNAVDAHILAAIALLDRDSIYNKNYPTSSTSPSYYIHDGAPTSSLTFLAPLIIASGYSVPKLHLPFSFVLGIAVLSELVHHCLFRWIRNAHLTASTLHHRPLLPVKHVIRCAKDENFPLEKATQELGYLPVMTPREGMARMIIAYKNAGMFRREIVRRKRLQGLMFWILIACFVMMLALAVQLLVSLLIACFTSG